MTAAAFQATIHGLRTVPSRGVVQLVLECPIEQLPHIAAVAEHGAWVAVARLNKEGAEQPRPQQDKPAGGARKSFNALSGAQQAGILCNEEPFWLFLKERENLSIRSSEQCAEHIRQFLNVRSRADIEKDHRTRVLWNQYVTDYRAWQREVEVIG
jgi:hypothetical protein